MAINEHLLYLFFLILVRMTSMFMTAPVFSQRSMPARYKIGLGGLMAILLTPVIDTYQVDLVFDQLTVIMLVFKEILTGVSIGFTMSLLFAGIEFAGEYISMDMGISMAQAFDPTVSQNMSIIATLKNILALLIFLIIDGHHFLVEAVAYSYKVVAIGDWQLSSLGVDKLIRLSAQVFIIGIKVAAPIMVALFLTSVAMGIIARAVPQMNIFFVGFPIRIAVGFLFLSLGFPLFIYLFQKLLNNFEHDIIYLLKVL